jgi:hypothetical protein
LSSVSIGVGLHAKFCKEEAGNAKGKQSSLEQHEMKKLLYGLTHLHGIVITR